MRDLFRGCTNPQMYQGPITPELLEWQYKRNREIERELKKDKARLRQRQIILLLGTGESGKSTFMKQMRLINGKRFTQSELEYLKGIIYENIYKGILFLIQARENFAFPWTDGDEGPAATGAKQLEEHFKANRATQRERARLNQAIITESEFLSFASALSAVWSDASIKKAFEHRAKCITEHFSENTRYYMNRIDQIAVKDYTPTDDDVVWSRRATECIVEEEFMVHNVPLVFVDVGGQTKERRKWCKCFEGMSSVLFLIAGSHYDEHYQDRVTGGLRNKLEEAITVFGGLINHEAFRRVAVIIFFNKTDVLTEKVNSRQSNIRDYFPTFPASSDPFKLNDVKAFLAQSFVTLACIQSNNHLKARSSMFNDSSPVSHSMRLSEPFSPPVQRSIYKHFTTAVDRRNIQTVFTAIQDHVLNMNIVQLQLK